MASPLPDFKAASRGLRRSPIFTTTCLAILSLASGAVITVLAVASNVLLRPLPVVNQDEIVMAWKEDYQAGFAHFPFSLPAVAALKAELTTVSDFATIDYNGAWPLSTTDRDQGFKLPVSMVSGHLFPMLGVRPVIGRLFAPTDDVIGGRRLIVIGENLWRVRYASDPTVIGKTISVLGFDHEIVGVVPADFAYPRGAIAWIPMLTWQGERLNNPDAVTQDIIARLKPGRTLEQFRAELEAARARAPLEKRQEFASHRVVARSFPTEVLGDLRPPILLLGVGALLVLVVACANIGSLLLVRSGERLWALAVFRFYALCCSSTSCSCSAALPQGVSLLGSRPQPTVPPAFTTAVTTASLRPPPSATALFSGSKSASPNFSRRRRGPLRGCL